MITRLGSRAVRTAVVCWLALGAPAFAGCIAFPPGLVPFSSIAYVTAGIANGDQLVVGALAGGIGVIARLPQPSETNQTFCANVELAPGQFYSDVYVPTGAERTGNFPAFAGLLVNPSNGRPYDGGVIPAAQLGNVYAFRIASVKVRQTVREWSVAGTLPTSVTALLPNGKVLLVAGGGPTGDPSLVSAQILDPDTGVSTRTGTPAVAHGGLPIAVRLNDGKILITGGSAAISAAELFDPATGTFVTLEKMLAPHGIFHTANVLPDGRVLIIGGCEMIFCTGASSIGAEFFDPATRRFSAAPPMTVNRNRHRATTLADGKILITGGYVGGQENQILDSAEIFDPVANRFTPAGAMSGPHADHFAVLLPSGKVLVGGGNGRGGSADLYDPRTGTFAPTGGPRFSHSMGDGGTLLNNGQVLVSGGYDSFFAGLAAGELYNPASGTFTAAGDMYIGRATHAATPLLDGRVLINGGLASCCNPVVAADRAEFYTPLTRGLVTSQTGLTFRAAQGATAVGSQTVAVLSPTDPIPWAVSVKTYSGGNWLRATPASATSSPGGLPVPMVVNVDPTGLAPQDYYGAVTLTPTDQKHPPVTVVVVFTIVRGGAPAPLQVVPGGLVFLGTVGVSPAPQTFTISNFTSRAVNFTASSPATFYEFVPSTGAVPAAGAASIRVNPSAASLTAGVYRNTVTLAFSDGTTQRVDVLLVVSPAGASLSLRGADAICTPTKLLPVTTSMGAGATAPVAWPAPLIVQVVNDCGAAINEGSVTASFTNGDPPISLVGIGGGQWSGTWVPIRESAGAQVRVDARTLSPALSGTVQVSVRVSGNPNVPLVASGGVLSSGDYISPPAAGLLVSVFGSELADGAAGAAALPLPKQLGSTRVFLGPSELPLVYASPNQVNVLVPYGTQLNAPLQLVVTRGNATSVPVATAIFDAQPAILATAGNGVGQGHIYKADASGAQILANAAAPASAGDVLVIYCVGLGAVTPAVIGGEAAPTNPLATAIAPVTVTVGGQVARTLFAGLTPGFTGLYQINVVLPADVVPGADVPVNVAAGGKVSPASIVMAVR